MENLKEINERLKEVALMRGICDDFYLPWKDKTVDKQELIDMYFSGLDFCLDKRFPSNEMIKEYFEKDLLRKNNVLLDDKYSLLNPRYSVILGNSNAVVRYNGIMVAQLYLRDNSKVNVSIKGQAHVIIHVYDNAFVKIDEVTSTNKPKIILYGHSSGYWCDKEIPVINK